VLSRSVAFNYTSTIVDVGAIPSGYELSEVMVDVQTPFDGGASAQASLSPGGTPLYGGTTLPLTGPNAYQDDLPYPQPTQIVRLVVFAPLATQGTGIATMTIRKLP
jgi:hypothetical protein